MKTSTVAQAWRDYRTARQALDSARDDGVPGLDFARLGTRLGAALAARGDLRLGLKYLIVPVASMRYFELSFAAEAVQGVPPGDWLDVSSPRLFPLYVAGLGRGHVEAWNPDRDDLEATQRAVRALRLTDQITLSTYSTEDLRPGGAERYAGISAISVVEHIAGADSDSDAVTAMYGALRPGGQLILTVPTDRSYREEFRAEQMYPTQPLDQQGRGYFFQRWYDRGAIEDRLSSAVGRLPDRTELFGEVRPGVYRDYQDRLARRGRAEAAADPHLIADGFGRFDSYDAMPGMGVCGLTFTKPE